MCDSGISILSTLYSHLVKNGKYKDGILSILLFDYLWWQPQTRQAFSAVVRIGTPFPSPAGECVPPLVPRNRLREREWGSQFRRGGRHCGTLWWQLFLIHIWHGRPNAPLIWSLKAFICMYSGMQMWKKYHGQSGPSIHPSTEATQEIGGRFSLYFLRDFALKKTLQCVNWMSV